MAVSTNLYNFFNLIASFFNRIVRFSLDRCTLFHYNTTITKVTPNIRLLDGTIRLLFYAGNGYPAIDITTAVHRIGLAYR